MPCRENNDCPATILAIGRRKSLLTFLTEAGHRDVFDLDRGQGVNHVDEALVLPFVGSGNDNDGGIAGAVGKLLIFL